MRILLKLTLDCSPEAAWRALHSPAVLREVMSPWMDIRAADPEGLPTRWEPGEYRVEAFAGGVLPVGEESIDLAYPDGLPEGVRMLRDTGGGRSGLVGSLRSWDHRMAVAPHPSRPGKTLYRDQLRLRAGLLAPAVWYGLWAFWQWRGARLVALAPGWELSLGADADAPAPGAAAGTAPAR